MTFLGWRWRAVYCCIIFEVILTTADIDPRITTTQHPLRTPAPRIYQGNPDEWGTLFEGDIRLNENRPMPRTAIKNETLLWPDGRVFYEIQDLFTREEKSIILSGMEEIRSKTCVQFEERVGQPDYVYIIRDHPPPLNFCWSDFGHVGNKQILNLGDPQCITMGVVAHELIHALGFYHEHTRFDRNQSVEIVLQNVLIEHRYKFSQAKINRSTSFGLPYDYGSIMHYGREACTRKKGRSTIVPRGNIPPGVQMGQRDGLSELDAKKIRILYGLEGVTCRPEVNKRSTVATKTTSTVSTTTVVSSTVTIPTRSTASTTIVPTSTTTPTPQTQTPTATRPTITTSVSTHSTTTPAPVFSNSFCYTMAMVVVGHYHHHHYHPTSNLF